MRTMIRNVSIACLTAAALSIGCSGDSKPISVCDPGFAPNAANTLCEPLPSSCSEDDPSSILAQCTSQQRLCYELGAGANCGECLAGFAEEDAVCVPVKTCAELDCTAEGRDCIDASEHAHARCDGCIDGRFDEAGVCVLPNCDEAMAGSMVAVCAADGRQCTATSSGAACGGCLRYFAEHDDACKTARRCAELECVAANRFCTERTNDADAFCGECLTGLVERSSTCVTPTVDAVAICGAGAGSLNESCGAVHRDCVVRDNVAVCGGCANGYELDGDTGNCELLVTCDVLDCGSVNRDCEGPLAAQCVGCVAGFVEDTISGLCRPVRTCADLVCGSADCADASDHEDASCITQCGGASLWNGQRCVLCPSCDDEGEVGRWPLPTTAGQCVCQTAPGYFYSTSADIGSFLCDADGDGWIRESARTVMTTADPALRTNARCDLRTIDKFVLVDEGAGEKEVVLKQPIALYESVRNDDDTILNATWIARGMPQYGSFGRRLQAAELNRLTKFCHTPTTDYNDNGVPDVAEWGTRSLEPTLLPEQRPFNEMSYFSELYWGSYQEPIVPGSPGTYIIAEKSRVLGAGGGAARDVHLEYGADQGSYWRTCEVRRDSQWDAIYPPIGMDFASVAPDAAAGFDGMNHHSLFKCMVVADEPDPAVPNQISPATLDAANFVLNQCTALEAALVVSGNPAETETDCTIIEAQDLAPGDVVWGNVPFIDYGEKWFPGEDTAYVRGCVNECVAQLPLCPGYADNQEAVNCLYARDDFGRFVQCDAWELCDGYDNDGDGGIDTPLSADDDPRLEKWCDTTQHGICRDGTTECIGGEVRCTRNIAPRGETCDGRDENCNGQDDAVDNPQSGADCPVPGEVGTCAQGSVRCDGQALFCNPNHDIAAIKDVSGTNPEDPSVGCDNIDNDCDGIRDEPPAAGTCPLPWRNWYYDGDRDGYGTASANCACSGNATTMYDSTVSTDCCDTDSGAKPSTGTYRTRTNACGGWDWNCNGTVSKYWNSSASAGCGRDGFTCDSSPSSSKWHSSVAGCGVSASRFDGCGDWIGGCDQDYRSRTQKCL